MDTVNKLSIELLNIDLKEIDTNGMDNGYAH